MRTTQLNGGFVPTNSEPRMVSTGSVTSVQLIELLTYRVYRLSIGTAQS
jgi:hypothetical protein